jgi:hypothetical protein
MGMVAGRVGLWQPFVAVTGSQGCMKRASWLADDKDPERHTAMNGQSFQLRAPGRPDTMYPARDEATLHGSPVLTET